MLTRRRSARIARQESTSITESPESRHVKPATTERLAKLPRRNANRAPSENTTTETAWRASHVPAAGFRMRQGLTTRAVGLLTLTIVLPAIHKCIGPVTLHFLTKSACSIYYNNNHTSPFPLHTAKRSAHRKSDAHTLHICGQALGIGRLWTKRALQKTGEFFRGA